MKLLTPLYAVMTLLLCSQHVTAETLINVTHTAKDRSEVSLTYEQAPRLVQVVKDSIQNIGTLEANVTPQPIYWLAAGLYDYNTEMLFQQKQQQILSLLKTQYNDINKPNNIQALKTLSTWIANNKFLRREFILLDYDAIRLKEELNPLLQGKYLLTLPSKPQDVLVLGAVTQNGPQPFVVRQNASQYIENAMPLKASENSFAWLIQPDGKIEKYPIAYWNQQHIDIAPGAIIYVDFDGVRDNEQKLNQQILELIRHWIR
ncbi:capsule biosynthesis GfcC family protein [Shewanella ulleungensis]|jgi:hypothetical protein|uniref:SLBB-domain like (DUF1017) n=1 Tax=Shewanella ulleungensis TaxID=2282699 RepID=A0ABQ2QW36_9GAMM|nr:capsule biosynthesis GfcC family protein [Shewanella ulleungensis]MCL1151218.1 capsule biosynthesis GfcC family protein [Shewanella ulleungensis]GGP96387.1 hypothetical protein GCM10009410_32950 [Shewanella ulleungensis]